MHTHFSFKIENLKRYNYFGVNLENIIINKIASIENPSQNALYFFNKLDKNLINELIGLKNCLLILPENIHKNFIKPIKERNGILFSSNPRSDYAIILNIILKEQKNTVKYEKIDNLIVKAENVRIGKNTLINPLAFIDHGSIIGDNCIIESGVRIGPRVKIGNNTIIRENSVVGGQGFGVEKNKNSNNIKIPHLGGVIIGDNVEIGALNTVVSGTIKPTIINDYVKTDDHVHIAHNCDIGENTIFTAGSTLGGSITIGENSWIGINATLMQKINIGSNVLIGIGAVVTKSFGSGKKIMGNPAREVNEVIKREKNLKIIYKRYGQNYQKN